jgi:hypothetical protein
MPSRRLITLNQIADALGVGFAMTVADDGVSSSRGLDANVGPENSGGNVDGSDLGNRNALFVAAEQPRLDPNDVQWVHHKASREKQIAFGPVAGDEGLTVWILAGHNSVQSQFWVSSLRPGTKLSWLNAEC